MKKLILGLILFAIGQSAFAQNTATPTNTFTPVFTWTFTNTPTNTLTNTATPTATNTPTFTSTATNTFTNTATSTATNTATKTFTNTVTNTFTITNTYTITPTFTNTFTPTVTPAITNRPGPFTENTGYYGLVDPRNGLPFLSENLYGTATATITPTPVNTYTPTNTATITNTPTVTNTLTPVGQQIFSFDSLSAGVTVYFPRTVSGVMFFTGLSAGNGAAPITFNLADFAYGKGTNNGNSIIASDLNWRFSGQNFNLNSNQACSNAFIIQPKITPTQTEVATIAIIPIFSP